MYICPETVRTFSWLGIRVHLTSEKISNEELTAFWKLTESHYLWIRVNDIFKDVYGVQIKIDYTVYLRHERGRMFAPKRMIDRSAQVGYPSMRLNFEIMQFQTKIQEQSSSISNLSFVDQNSIKHENLLSNLFEIINSELRSLRHRINDSNEASKDRHSQLMQLLFSIFNSNSNNYQKKNTEASSNNNILSKNHFSIRLRSFFVLNKSMLRYSLIHSSRSRY